MMALKRGETREAWLYQPNGLAVLLEPAIMPEQDGWLQWAQLIVDGYVEQLPRSMILDRHIDMVFMNEQAGFFAEYGETIVVGLSRPLRGNVLVYRRKT